MTGPRLTFYFAPGASSMAPHIALYEAGAEFDAIPVSLGAKATRTDRFLAMNPVGQVPLLLIDGRPLTEVAAILFYLARRFPEAKLLPERGPGGTAEGEAQVVSWMSFVASSLHWAWSAVGRASDDEQMQKARASAWRAFGVADRRLGARPWACGEYSIADIHLFRLYFRLRHSLHPDVEEFPNLAAHYDRMIARPAVQKTCEVEAAIGYEIRHFTPPDPLNA